MEYVAESEDNAHGEAIVTSVWLGEPQLLLHAHRGQRPQGHAGEDEPEPITLRLDNVAVICYGEVRHEYAVLR